MISFVEKRAIQSTILEQNKILSSNPSFANKRQAQKIKAEAMIKLGLINQPSVGFVKPEKLNLPTINFDGDVWYILSQGTTREDGKTLLHLSSVTRGRQAKNGVHPIQIQDWIDLGSASILNNQGQDNEDQPIERKSTSHLYEFDPNRKPAQRKKDNSAAMALLDRIDSGEIDASSLTDEQKATLARYSGTGGALIGADGKKGSAYEYYTPKPIAEGVWDLMSELGFSGGKVLDPSAGVGVFGAVAPANAAIDAIELNETSGRINGLVNDGPGYSTTVSAFEKVAANTQDESYDAIVTNVPFGGVADRGGNQLLDSRYQKEPLQNYFILRSLEKLKPGGLAVFITPPRCVSGKGGKEEDLRVKASFMAEFLGAYRLPNSVFGTASADTMTDVIAFRKYSRETLDKISELREQSPQILIEANVQWQEFIDGHYFDREGKRFILGEFVPKNPNKFRDVDRVINPANIAEIGRMLKRFPDSRINWDLLGSVETSPIIYGDGDTLTQAGQTLKMKDGRWVAIARTEESVDMAKLAGQMATPYNAFENKITWAGAIKYFDYMTETSQDLDIPAWARGAINEIKRLSDEGERGKYWNAGVIGMSVAQVLEERLSEEVGVKYVDEYPALSEAMQRVSTIAKGRPSSVSGKIKDGLLAIGNHYQKKTGFSAIWRGDVQQEVTTMEITADSSFEGLRYKTRSAWVTLDDAKGIYGDDFDPVGDQAWCISPDGKSVTRADDYYVGNYAEFLKRADAEIAAATDDKVRDKLLRQKLDADSRVYRIDVSKLTFNLFTPYVTQEEKAEFLRRFVHSAAVVVFDEKTGEKRVDIDIPGSKLTDREKLINRIGDYLKNGTITLGGAKLDMEKAKALQELRRMVNTANEQFNGWVRGNSVIMRRLEGISSDPTKLRFRQAEDSSPMNIQGMSDLITPHGYQFAEIRRQSREFGGVNGFGVGLGKTLTALAAVQYAQSIGVKKKTFFVVPNSVLSNWRKEAARAYTNQDELLFVGLRVNKSGKSLVNSTNFDVDLTAIMENRHSKIFMTMEAFERIRLRDETIDQYEQFLRRVDASFAESEDKKEDERAKSKQAGLVSILSKKTGSAPYLEDLGVDSIVIDEAHCFPAGTMVDDVPIEKIRIGDMVKSFNHATYSVEYKVVTDVMRRVPAGLVRVNLRNGKSIVCTHDHEFFIPGIGYIAAEFLNKGYNVLVNYLKMDARDEVFNMQHGVPSELLSGKEIRTDSRKPNVLQQTLRKTEAVFDTETEPSLQSLQNRVLSIDGATKIAQEECIDILHPEMRCGQQAQKGSDIQGLQRMQEALRAESCTKLEISEAESGSIFLRQSLRNNIPTQTLGGNEDCHVEQGKKREASHGIISSQLVTNAGSCGEEQENKDCSWIKQGIDDKEQRGEWLWNDNSAKDACGCVEMGGGVCCENGCEEGKHNALSLQARFGESSLDDSNRGGWELSQMGESGRIGFQKGRVFDLIGVDSVEILESGSDGRFGGVCPDGYVYDITVEENHNFFAEGILVHNCFKNSAETIDFKGAKFLSLSPASQRGLDAQAKAWFIRGKSQLGDGVLLLSATSITSSPLEIYSMLSLSAGHERVNDMCLGIKGADNFMEVFVQKDNQDDVTIDGVARTTDVFVGLNNVSILRKAIGEVASIKSAEDVGEQIIVPDREEKASAVTLTGDIVDRLSLYKRAFRFAIDTMAGKEPNRGGKEAFESVSAHFGEEMDLIGHPFNLINKMTLLIADPELDQRATFYNFIGAQKDKAIDAVNQFNAKSFTEERARFTPMSSADSVVSRKVTKDEAGNEITILKMKVVASVIDGNRIAIDTITPETQSAFEDIAEKIGLDLDVSVPPKLAAMLENFQHEQATPRGVMDDGSKSPVVKQIIFCDILSLHNKIKRLLSKRAGVPSSAIAIITGKINNKPDEILAVQDGFNAFGEDNKYRVVIANEKAEVGINLQKGTQATHHLTIGWTPDSLEQRNGRGARQGNKTERVNSYYYDADGTFDTSKRSMVDKKADWIGQVMDVNGSENIAVTGGLSREQMESLIEVVGDTDAMKRIQETIAAKEAETRAATNRDKQMINLDTIRKQKDFLKSNPSAVNFIIDKMIGLWNLEKQMWMLNDRINNPRAKGSAVAKNKLLLADINARISGLRNSIERSATITKTTGYNSITRQNITETASLDDVFKVIRGNRKQKDDDVIEILRGQVEPSFKVSAIEGGPIANDWQSEVDMANSMIEESKNNFMRQASERGSYPSEIAKIMADGAGQVHDGKPIVTGMFVRFDGGDIGLVDVTDNTIVRANKSGRFSKDRLANYIKYAVETIYPGSSGYDSCLDEAAEIEDIANSNGVVENSFNSIVPLVAQRRKTDVLAEYSHYKYALPQPYFPFVITSEDTAVRKHIAASQRIVVKSIRGSSFTALSSVAVTEKSNIDLSMYDALVEYAKAHNLKLVFDDFGNSDYWLGQQIEKTITADMFGAAITGATEDEIRNQAISFMLNSLTWFDFNGRSPIDARMLPYELQKVLNAAIKAVSPVPVAAASSNNVEAGSIVGIKVSSTSWADISVWKENIKASAVAAGDGKYKFDGKTKIWNVLQPAWDHLIANYPGAADKVELVSGTLSYL